MSTAPEIRRMVTREMIEAHYKRVMTTALTLLSQDCVALAQNLLSEAIRLPYPTPAPASMPEAPAPDVAKDAVPFDTCQKCKGKGTVQVPSFPTGGYSFQCCGECKGSGRPIPAPAERAKEGTP